MMYPPVGMLRVAIVASILAGLIALSASAAEAAVRELRHEATPLVHAINHRLQQDHQAVERIAKEGQDPDGRAGSTP